MKFRYYFPIVLLSGMLLACGGSEEDSSGEKTEKTAPYYITLEDNSVEGKKDKDCNYFGDNISGEAKFSIGNATLILLDFTSDAGDGEVSDLEGKSFAGSMDFDGDVTEGEATITGTKEGREVSFGRNFDLSGTFNGAGGEEGSFTVSYYSYEG